MIQRILIFHEDGTCEQFHMRGSPVGPVATEAPKKRKKRAKPRRRCQTCNKLVDRDQFDAHVEGHAPQAKQAAPRSWEEIEAEAAEALDEPVQEENA